MVQQTSGVGDGHTDKVIIFYCADYIIGVMTIQDVSIVQVLWVTLVSVVFFHSLKTTSFKCALYGVKFVF